MPEDDDFFSDFSYLWGAVEERAAEEDRTREQYIYDLLRMHEYASKHPEGSHGWFFGVTHAQRLYEFHLKRGKGRPKRKRDLDDYALAFMVATSYITGETSPSKLAEKATGAGLVPKKAAHKSRVERLVRKYSAYKRKPRPLNLSGGVDEDAHCIVSNWRSVKQAAWLYAMKEPHTVLKRARDLKEFLLVDAPHIEQEFEDDGEWQFMVRPLPTVEK